MADIHASSLPDGGTKSLQETRVKDSKDSNALTKLTEDQRIMLVPLYGIF